MSRLKLEDILIPGATFEVKKIDFNDPKVKESIERVRKAQEECILRKKVDLNLLRNTVVNI